MRAKKKRSVKVKNIFSKRRGDYVTCRTSGIYICIYVYIHCRTSGTSGGWAKVVACNDFLSDVIHGVYTGACHC